MRLTVASRLPVTLLLLAWASVTSSSRSAPSPTRGVVNAGTLQALSTSQAARHVPVQLRGVVTFFDAADGVLFVQDDSGGALVDTAGLPLELRPGLEVQVDGVSDSRGGPPLVSRPRVRVVGEAPLPPARRVLASHLKGRSAHHEWIEFQGRVALFGEGERSQLLVHEYRDFLRVHVRDLQGREPSSLVGDHMRLRGVYGPVFDEQRRITGYQLWVPAAEHIVHVPAPPTASGLAEPLPPRKRVADILNLSPEDAARSFPVSVRGVVTYYDAEWCMLFVQDSTGGIYVQCRSHDFPITTGQLVEVAGVTAPGEYSPIIDRPRLRLLGRAPLPRAETLSAEQLAYGRGEARWIMVRGVVQSVHRVGVRHAGFDLAAEGGRRTQVIVPDVDALPSHLLGATVRFLGVGVTIFNNKRQLLGAEVLSPSLAFAEREEAAPPDLLATPVQRVRTLLQFRSGDDPSTRKRVQGIVTYQRPGGSFYLVEQGDGLYVQTTESLPLRAGDRVDVMGFPALGEYTPRLRAAYVRKLAAGEPPEPVSLSAEQALSGDHDAALVRLRGRLLDRAFAAGPALLLQAPPFVFQATLENAERQEFEELRNGSLLELTGICSVQRDERQVPRSFQVLLRSSADVVVLESGPWWTRQHTLWAVGLLAFAAPAALGWGALLKRQVRLRTEALRQQSARYRDLVENANDAIYTLDAAGRFTSMNPAGEQMTGYSREEVLSIGLADLVPPEHAARTRERLALEIAAGLPAVQELEIRAKDGRPLVLEVSSRPLYEKGRIVGLEGIARDIGERRLAQEIKAQFSAVLEERSRIARELHDSLDQGFWGILLQLEASSEALGGGLSSARTHLELARNLVLHCQTEAHRSVWDLRSTVLDRTDLPNALAAAARLVAVSCSTPVETKVVGGPRPLPASVENNLLRIGQEAITNAARHARARAIVAELHFEPGRVRLAVSDDGSGFDVDSTAYADNGHFGLIGMRERAKRIGGQLTIESVPGAGSTVTVELPTSGDGAP